MYPKISEMDLNNQLIQVCKSGNISNFIFRTGMDINFQESTHKNTPLMFACFYNHIHIVKMLIDFKANVNLQNDENGTALMFSLKNIDIVRLLLENKADPNIKNKYNSVIIHSLRLGCGKVIVKLLLEYKADVYIDELFDSLKYKQFDIFNLLLHSPHTIDINTSTRDNKTSFLELASNDGYTEVVKELLEFKADPNSKSLSAAIKQNKKEIVQLLLEAKANPNLEFNYSFDKHYLIESKSEEIVDLLLEYKADPNLRDLNGNTALIKACSTGQIQIVRKLVALHSEAELNYKNKYGECALLVCSRSGNLESIETLLKCKANPNLQDKNLLDTPLICATRRGRDDIIELLLKYGANPNIKNRKKTSALILACNPSKKFYVGTNYEDADNPARYRGFKKIIELLLEYNAIIDFNLNLIKLGKYARQIQIKKYTEILTEKVIDSQGNERSVFPFPTTSGGHIQLFQTIAEYAI